MNTSRVCFVKTKVIHYLLSMQMSAAAAVHANFQGGDDSDNDDEIDQSNISEDQWQKLLVVFPSKRKRLYDRNILSGNLIVPSKRRREIVKKIEGYRESGSVPIEVAKNFKSTCTPNFLKQLKVHHLLYPKNKCAGTGAEGISSHQFDECDAPQPQQQNLNNDDADEAAALAWTYSGGIYIYII